MDKHIHLQQFKGTEKNAYQRRYATHLADAYEIWAKRAS